MIKGIQIIIDEKTMVIPIDKAKELYEDLHALFGTKNNINYSPTYPFEQVKDPLDLNKWYGEGQIMYKNPIMTKLKEDMSI